MKTELINNWKLGCLENKEVEKEKFEPRTGAEVAKRLKCIPASVPGNFELDMMREGLLPDLYAGTNVFEAQKLENLHLYYFTQVFYEPSGDTDDNRGDSIDNDTEDVLVFEGIDTFAEIFINGEKIGFTENMLHKHEFPLAKVKPARGKLDLLVHIFPTAVYARKFDIPAMCFGMKYNTDSLAVRKAPYMFGWDIMPRIVSGGLWKPVKIEKRPKIRVENPFIYTDTLSGGVAELKFTGRVIVPDDFISDYFLQVKVISDGETRAETKQRCFTANQRLFMRLADPELWWPKNYGKPNLYTVKVELIKNDEVVYETSFKTGVRTVRLIRTSCAGDNGEFLFEVNGKKVFCLGTNYVPTDAFPSRQKDYDLRALELLNEVGCNMIRFWGGNIYPSQEVYDYCDEHGIMCWQDFAFGCGHYPDDERLCRLTREEVKHVALAYRNHPSLVLYAGDNECDTFVDHHFDYDHSGKGSLSYLDPNYNALSRNVILRELRNHDATRPYLPSSPYLDETAHKNGLPSETHLWGPRDYFKGDYYKNPVCHFASEIGYHGCNSVESLKKFISEESFSKAGTSDGGCKNAEWLAHAACMETVSTDEGNPYAYRIPLMISQVERIFTERKADLKDFVKQSQISQAEADKYFIERFRMEKWRKTGIIWWNIIDGWPQISDAVVDWYGTKKLAFYYIRRAQQPFFMMVGEPADGKMKLYAVSDLQKSVKGKFTVKNLQTGEVACEGEVSCAENSTAVVAEIPETSHAFYFIEWETDAGKGVNHHACSLGEKWVFEEYIENMRKAGFYSEFAE